MIEEGLNLAVTDLLPIEFDTKGKYRVKLTLVVIYIYMFFFFKLKLFMCNSSMSKHFLFSIQTNEILN